MLWQSECKIIIMVNYGTISRFSFTSILQHYSSYSISVFTAQCPVAGFDEGTLSITFADLRQLLDLFTSSDWSSYLADFGRDGRNKYIRVQPQTAVALLEKYVHLIFSKLSM